MIKPSPFISGLFLLTAVAWVIFLFWSDIKRIRVVKDPAGTESVAWLYVFAFAVLLAVGVQGISIYYLGRNAPTALTGDEFAEPYIRGKHFRLVDLVAYSGDRVIEGRTFEDCWLYGPAVAMLADRSDIGDSEFWGRGGMDATFFVASLKQSPAGLRLVPAGAMVFKDCKFRRCHFLGISIIVETQEKLEEIRRKNREMPADR